MNQSAPNSRGSSKQIGNDRRREGRIRRRGHGEGSIGQRRDGRWCARFRDAAGKRQAVYGRTRAEVAATLNDELKAVREGTYAPEGAKTISQLAEEYLAAVRMSVAPKTLESYEWALRNHVLPRMGRVRLSNLRAERLQAMYGEMLAAGRAPKTVRHVHAAVRAMLGRRRWAVLADKAPGGRLSGPKVPRRELPMLTPQQVRSFIAAASGHPLEALFVLAVTTGARSGELLGLKWDDVDIDAGTMRVRRILNESNGRFSLSEPKTPRSRRTVSLSAQAIAALRHHRARQAEQALRLGAAWGNRWNLVFTNSAGGPLDRHNVLRRDLRPLLRNTRLPVSLTFHDLRHVAASLLLNRGLPVPLVSEMLGHADAAITFRVYAHAVPHTERQAAQAMDAILGA